MGPVFLSRRRYRVAVNSNDHPPPHVHVYGKGREARFVFDYETSIVELWDFDGDWTRRQLNEVGAEIAEKLDECCAEWRRVHG